MRFNQAESERWKWDLGTLAETAWPWLKEKWCQDWKTIDRQNYIYWLRLGKGHCCRGLGTKIIPYILKIHENDNKPLMEKQMYSIVNDYKTNIVIEK